MTDTTRVRIHGVAHGGAGVGRSEPASPDAEPDGRTWFVHDALPGELVEVELLKAKRRYLRGRAVQILESSPDRVEAPCAFASESGGCSWQYVRAGAQAQLKGEVVAGQLRRLVDEVHAVVPSPRSEGYRRRARMHYAREGQAFVLGFHRFRTREIEDQTGCMVLEPALDAALQRLRAIGSLLPRRGEVHGVTDGRRVVLGLPGIKMFKALHEALEGLVEDDFESASDGLVGIVIRGGRRRITIGQGSLPIDGGRYPAIGAGPFDFAQAQAGLNEQLVQHVAERCRAGIGAGAEVLELYAGSGNFTRAVAPGLGRVRAFDDARDAINRLRGMAREHNLPVDARRANVDRLLPQLVDDEERFDVVLLDPPRGGVGREGAAAIARLAKRRIVYVSCDPATLARDLEAMLEANPTLRVVEARVFDLMPMTAEVETVVVLEPGGASDG